jgi:hypothetical protein
VTETEEEPEPIKCPYCDRMSDVKGHVVAHGRIAQCPSIGITVLMNGRSTL